MMELMVKPFTMPEAIEFNFDELKAELEERARQYEMTVYTDDQIKLAKADRATLNKLKKTLNDERIRMEKEYMIPFNEFKARINEIISIIDKPIMAIDTQIKEYEEEQKAEKERNIKAYLHTYELPYEIPVEMLFSQKWLNATVTMKQIYEEVNDRVAQVTEDVKTLEQLEEYRAEAIQWYAHTLDLRDTLNHIRQMKEAKAAAEKIEQELKKQETPVVEPQPEQKPEAKPEPEVKSQWIKFEALLTVEQAKSLKAFFEYNKINYRAI